MKASGGEGLDAEVQKLLAIKTQLGISNGGSKKKGKGKK